MELSAQPTKPHENRDYVAKYFMQEFVLVARESRIVVPEQGMGKVACLSTDSTLMQNLAMHLSHHMEQLWQLIIFEFFSAFRDVELVLLY